MVILIGSWITHTTTATIDLESESQTSQSEQSLSDSNTAPQENNLSPAPAKATDAAKTETKKAEKLTAKPIIPLTSRLHKIRRGESLGSIFKKEGLGHILPHKISQHPTASQLVSLSIGKNLDLRFDDANQLRQIQYPVSSLTELIVDIEGEEIIDAKVVDLTYQTVQHDVSAEITSSLYESALDAGLSNNLIMEMEKIFGWDVDFVQDIRVGDNFHVIYTDYRVDDKKIADGDILAAEFTTQGQTYRAIRFADQEGNASYYTPEGESMLGTFLRSPVEFSRISSRFGKRKHPISKKWKAHNGVDYAASRGTPIRATADGNVIHAGNKGGYGKTVVLRHAGRFSTLYAHMNGYAKGIRNGARVTQGQIIGYVGSTGYSTGPHLHYEFRVDGAHRNPLTYKTPKASSVAAELKEEFLLVAAEWGRKLDTVQKNYQIAKAEAATKKI